MNKVIMAGRLTKDPELRQTTSGVSVASFAIAVNRMYKNADGSRTADFFNCTAWRTTGEFVCRNFRKGDGIVLCGSIENRQYQDNNGHNRTATTIVVESVEFGQGRGGGQSSDHSDMEPVDGDDDLPF